MTYPPNIRSVIEDGGTEGGVLIEKSNPATGELLSSIESATKAQVDHAVRVAEQSVWKDMSVVDRANILKRGCEILLKNKDTIAECIALEAGRSRASARKEVEAASECGLYLASHLEVFEDEIVHSIVPQRTIYLRRFPLGVGALITPYNNPLAGIAWKIFPSLLCGNSVVIKAHELAPYTPHVFAETLFEAGVPRSAIAIVEGGGVVGRSLIENPNISFVSFTGSSKVAIDIIKTTAPRLLRVSVESGGKNPIVVCDDADLKHAASLAVRSAFIDGGQRCAAASRILVFDTVYEEFKRIFLENVAQLRIGIADTDDYGAIISERRLNDILSDIKKAQTDGARLIIGGNRIAKNGYYIEPTVFENVDPNGELSQKEIFGPVVVLFRVQSLKEAINLANNSQYLLTSAIHTQSEKTASQFVKEYRGGVVRVNGPTFGSEPHVPFGGEGLSGNGWREPGLAALHFYSNLKQVSTDTK